MRSSIKFILKIFTGLLILTIIIFLILFLKNLYDIKTGKLNIEDYQNDFSKIDSTETLSIEELTINYKTLITGNFPSYGAEDPELTIIEFGSFSCPYSKQVSNTIRKMMLKYKDNVKFIYRDFPIDELYPDSSALALAGKCANEQNKFWAFHDKMFSNQDINYYESAIQSGLNGDKFVQCIKAQTYKNQIIKDLEDGLNSGVRGTPTFFFIKKGSETEPAMQEGVIPEDVFDNIINKLLNL